MRIRNIKDKKEILENSDYVVSNPEDYKGKWKSLFNNNNDINIEIGPGKCNFIYEMALKNPNKNYIGIERIDTVLALGLKEISKKQKLNNLKLINYDANTIDKVFKQEINTIYLNFSDPWPKKRHEKRRLTNFRFLEKYDIISLSDKKIIMKTDNKELFEYSIISLSNYGYKIIDLSLDLTNKEDYNNIMTEYEQKFVSKGYNIYMIEAIKEESNKR